jgi:hypothetical protein
MRIHRALPGLALFGALALAGCGDDTIAGPSAAQFQGNWTATSIVYTNPDGSTQNLMEIVPGSSLTMIVAANGTFSGVFHVPGTPYDQLAITGTISNVTATHADVAFTWPPPFDQAPPINNFTATYTLQGNFLTFNNPSTTNPLTQANASVAINMTRS